MKLLISMISLSALAILGPVACSSPQTASDTSGHDTAATLEAVPLGNIRNTHQLGDVWFGGQPSTEDFALLKAAGVKTIINLRHDAENEGMVEATVVSATEMGYIHIPFSGQDQLTDDIFEAVRQELKTAERPLLLHCASANRVGATWLPYRVLDEGVPFEEALREAKEIGLRSPGYEERARQYIADQQAK